MAHFKYLYLKICILPKVIAIAPELSDDAILTHLLPDATYDAKTKQVMRSILSDENAQLVVLNGDLISGDAIHDSDSSEYLHEVVEPLVEINQSWATTYGNHDCQDNLDPLKDIYEQEKQYSTSLTRSDISGTQAGITNYYLTVYPHNNSDGPPALLLWFFDSRGGRNASNRDTGITPGVRGDWVDQSVKATICVAWNEYGS